MALEPGQYLHGMVDFIRKSRDLAIELCRSQEWLVLSILLVTGTFFLFSPNVGLISQALPEEKPILYGAVFWAVQLSILGIGILLTIAQLILRHVRSVPNRRIASVLIVALSSFLVFIGLTIPYRNIQSSVRPTNYLKCDDSGDCFSWGENTLFSYGYFEGASEEWDASSYIPGNEDQTESEQFEEEWISNCQRFWRIKSSGTALYFTDQFSSLMNDFNNLCKVDAESRVYLNNIDAMSSKKSGVAALLDGRDINLGIAVSLPISRQGGESESQEILRGVALAQKEANDGELKRTDGEELIPNINILVGVADDGFDVENTRAYNSEEERRARSTALGMSHIDQVVAVIGHFSTDATVAAGVQYAESESGLVAISPTSTAARKGTFAEQNREYKDTGVEFTDNIFRTALSEDTVVSKLVEKIIEKGYRKVAIVYEQESDYSKAFKEVFENIFVIDEGLEVLSAQEVCDFSLNGSYQESDCMDAAIRENADAFLLIPSTKNSKGIRDLIVLNYQQEPSVRKDLIGADSMYDASFLSEFTEGMMLYVPWHRDLEDEGSTQFVEKAQGMFGTPEINWRTAMAYDATRAIIQGISTASEGCSWEGFLSRRFRRSTGYLGCIRRNMMQTLRSDNFEAGGVFGPRTVRFRGNDRDEDAAPLGTFIYVKESEEEGKDYDFAR